MKDIRIEDDKKLMFKNGDLVLVKDSGCIIQQVYVALRTFLNDWYLDYTKGTDYFNLMKAGNDQVLKAKIKKAVREVNDVDQITKFEYTRENKLISVNISVLINDEEYSITEGVGV